MSNDQKIIEQVEFYFGDANLPRDKFMQERVKEDDGWVSLETIASFTRMKALGADAIGLASLLKESSNLLEVSEDGKKVRRQQPLSSVASLYVKGFPQDATLEQLQAFFRDQCPADTVKAVWMRRVPNSKIFKGSVFLDLSSEEVAQQILATPLTYTDGKTLIIMTKAAYLEGKAAEKTAAKSSKAAKKTDVARDYVRGCLVKLEHADEISHQAVRTALGSDHPVAYVDHFDGAHWIRFKEPIAEKVLETLSEITVGNHTIKLTAVSETEEAAYFARLAEKLAAAEPQNKKKRVHRDHDDAPATKVSKVTEEAEESAEAEN